MLKESNSKTLVRNNKIDKSIGTLNVYKETVIVLFLKSKPDVAYESADTRVCVLRLCHRLGNCYAAFL